MAQRSNHITIDCIANESRLSFKVVYFSKIEKLKDSKNYFMTKKTFIKNPRKVFQKSLH